MGKSLKFVTMAADMCKLPSLALTASLVGQALLCGFTIGAETHEAHATSNTVPRVVFGVVPQQSATRLAQVWVPLLNRLTEISGYPIEFATAKDIPSFEACLAQGAYDVAYMNPYHYTVFHRVAGYEAFARQADKRLKGVIVARSDSLVQTLSDLDGEQIAFPSPAAFGASVVPRAELRGQNISFTPHYVKSHDSVYRSVAAGLFAAGGGVGRTLGNVPQDLRAQLKVIYQTNDYTPHAFATVSTLSDGQREAIAAALLSISDEALLKPLGMSGFEVAANADWDDVRALDLTQSQTEIVAAGTLQCLSD